MSSVYVPARPSRMTFVSTVPSRLPVPLRTRSCPTSFTVKVLGHVPAAQYGAAESSESANAAAGTRTRRHSNPKAARFMMDLPLIGRGIMRSIPPGCTEHVPAAKLFVAKRFDRMKGCGFPGRIGTEADSDRRADHEASDRPEPREDHVHAEGERDAVSA